MGYMWAVRETGVKHDRMELVMSHLLIQGKPHAQEEDEQKDRLGLTHGSAAERTVTSPCRASALTHDMGITVPTLQGGDETRRVRLPQTKSWCHFLKDVIPGLHFYYSPSLC